MTDIARTCGGHVVPVAFETARPECWQCEGYVEDRRSPGAGRCSKLAGRLRAQGFPIVGDVPVRIHGDTTACGGDFVLTLAALDELVQAGFVVTYASQELWDEWLTTAT